MIVAVIPGSPHGQGRPRAARRGAFISVYEAPEDRKWKEAAAKLFVAAMAGRLPLAGPISATIVAVWPQPKATRKADRLCRAWRVGKPDCDNVAKAVLDAANEIVYEDDAQVCELRVVRIVGREGEEPRVEVAFSPAKPLTL